MNRNELLFHILVISFVVLLCFFFLFKRAVNFDKNYPNPIPLTSIEKIDSLAL